MSASRNPWKSWKNHRNSSHASWQSKGSTANKQPTRKVTKRSLSKTGVKASTTATKRQKVISDEANKRKKLASYSHLPLTKVIFVNPGEKTGVLPELVFGGFYDCARVAKLSKPKHVLQIDVTKKNDKKKCEENRRSTDYRVSIPVTFSNIETVSVISGMNPLERLLKAHSDRTSLRKSIEHWSKVIDGRVEALRKKQVELRDMSQVDDEAQEGTEQEDEVVNDTNANEIMEESDEIPKIISGKVFSTDSDVEVNKETTIKESKTEDCSEDPPKSKKKRELSIRKRKFVTSVVEKLATAVEKAKQSLTTEQGKLDKISEDWGEELAYFQNEVSDEAALFRFKEELQEGFGLIEPDDDNVDNTTGGDNEDVEMVTITEVADKSESAEENADKSEVVAEKGNAHDKFKSNSKKEDLVTDSSSSSKVNEAPVWLVVVLKKPLEKIILSANAPSKKDTFKKATMILMKFHPKYKKTIVLKGITYQGSEEYLKVLNQVLEGPWKDIRKDPSVVFKDKYPYSLEKTLQYLVKCHTRQEVLDNTMDNCQLCDNPLKRMELEQHIKELCSMREEQCQFCETAFPISAMKDHHSKDCEKYPISCPLKCPKKFARSESEEHQKKCVNFIVECEYEAFGCNSKIKRKDFHSHKRSAVFQHLELVKSRVNLLTNYLVKNDPGLQDIIKPTSAE